MAFRVSAARPCIGMFHRLGFVSSSGEVAISWSRPGSRLVVVALLPRLEYLGLTLPKAIRKRKTGRSGSIYSLNIEWFQFRHLPMKLR